MRERATGLSYAEAVRRVEGQRKQQNTEEKTNDKNLCMEKRHFLAFIAMVINCAADIKTKSERIKMVLHAARVFLKVEDVTGEELDNTLREGLSATQSSGAE